MDPKIVVMRIPLSGALLAAATLAFSAAAFAWTPASALADTVTSSNWAGYAVHRPGVKFNKVFASWRQPSASCRAGDQSYSAIWVGLGGYNETSNALEQVGSEVDCTSSGRVSSSVWYELVPAPSQPIRMHVRPGDAVTADVGVTGRRVSVSIDDLTQHRLFHRTLSASGVDVSSAEWIVEAPSDCISTDACQTLPLANFGSATFSSADARSANGHIGSISDPAWSATKIKLTVSGRRFAVYDGPTTAAGMATPSGLTARGRSFRVTFSKVTLEGNPFLTARQSAVRAGYLVHPGR